jgi:hypothetical protein
MTFLLSANQCKQMDISLNPPPTKPKQRQHKKRPPGPSSMQLKQIPLDLNG